MLNEVEQLPEIEQREKLKQMVAEELRRLISLGHPSDHGEPYSRFEVMDEIRRRGIQVFVDLKWPFNPEAIYKNKYTGCEESLLKVAFSCCHSVQEFNYQPSAQEFNEKLKDHGWIALENWWPIDQFKDDELFDEYNPKKGQTKLGVFK